MWHRPLCPIACELPRGESWRAVKSKQLLQSRADFDVFGKGGEDWSPFGPNAGRNDHSVGFDAAKFARREVHHHDHLAADQRFRLVILRDARANLAHFAADV